MVWISRVARHTAANGAARVLGRTVATAALSFALAACQNVVETSGVYYNTGLADASNNVLLTNVVRSAKGYPTYYSAIGDYSGSLSTSNGPSLSADIPLNATSETSLSASLGPSTSRDRNANVSSLETKEFTQAMNTEISPQLLAFLLRSRHGTHFNLVLALVVDTIAITRAEFDTLLVLAQQACRDRYLTLRSAHRAICDNYAEVLAAAACGSDPLVDPNGLVRLRSEPADRCGYSQFRALAEAFIVNEPRLERGQDNSILISIAAAGASVQLFRAKGAGLLLRSPNEIVHYLGEVVRTSMRTGWAPKLTTDEGDSVPIFEVHSGNSRGRASAVARVDGEEFWIARQELDQKRRDFSNNALAILKDFQALNTSEGQLPESTKIFIGRAP